MLELFVFLGQSLKEIMFSSTLARAHVNLNYEPPRTINSTYMSQMSGIGSIIVIGQLNADNWQFINFESTLETGITFQ